MVISPMTPSLPSSVKYLFVQQGDYFFTKIMSLVFSETGLACFSAVTLVCIVITQNS